MHFVVRQARFGDEVEVKLADKTKDKLKRFFYGIVVPFSAGVAYYKYSEHQKHKNSPEE